MSSLETTKQISDKQRRGSKEIEPSDMDIHILQTVRTKTTAIISKYRQKYDAAKNEIKNLSE